MILYFADRQLNIIGQASTELPDGLIISGDKKVAEIETGVSTFECDITFDKKTRSKVEEFTQVGNYVLRNHNGETELYTIIDAEIDTKKQEVYIYAEDDGMDLLNEIVGVYEADQAYAIDHYIKKYASGAGFEIGINEAKGLTRQLSWDGESTATARIASVATQFDGCEISFSFEVDRLYVVKKYINIYKQRGKDVGVTLRLNQDVDSIVTSKSIGNLATALQCTGGAIEQSSTILEKAKSSGIPQIAYTVDLKTVSRTKNTVTFAATVSGALTSEDAKLAEDYGLKASIYIGGSWRSVTLKATDKDNKKEWSGTANNSAEYEFTVSGAPAGVVTYSDIKFKVERTDSKGGIIGVLSEKACSKFSVPNYIEGGENGEDIETRNITIEGYAYDDKDFYVEGNVLKSREALKKWSRVVWKTDESQKNGGHITKLYSYDTPSQETLCKRAISELKKLREMEVNYDVEIKKFPENVSIGDRVNIVDDAGELYVSARILKLEQSVSEGEHKATLGEYLIKGSGIHQKVAELAEQFAKSAVSATRAMSIANKAKEAAAEAKSQAESLVGGIGAAQQAAQSAQEAATAAGQTASAAQEKAAEAEQAVAGVVGTVAEMEESIVNAQQAAQQAQQAAQTAENKVIEAQQAAQTATTKASEAVTAAGEAQSKADSAADKADAAKSTAEQAISNAEKAATTAEAAKLDAVQAQRDIDALGDDLTTIGNTMTANYARKTDLTESEAQLQTQITQNAAGLSSTAKKVQRIDETANNAHELLKGAIALAEKAAKEAIQAEAEAEAAQTAADEASQAAQAAVVEHFHATELVVEAQVALDDAVVNLNFAVEILEEIQSQADSTEEEIAEAQAAVKAAREYVNSNRASYIAASAEAADAQAKADAAVLAADAALVVATDAANKAALARQVAAEAEGNAEAAQAAAAEAEEIAAEALRNATTLAANAENAQRIANNAVDTADAAQRMANEAADTVERADAALTTARENLENILSSASATAEEIAAAQAAVANAQAAVTKAQADAEAAQAAVEAALLEVANAQAAADAAKADAEEARAAADAAQAAAAEAKGIVYGLAVRTTETETQIRQNANAIELRVTKEEVAESLGDTNKRVTAAEALIQQLAESISMLVRDGNGGSMLRQDVNGLWYFNIGGLEKSLSDTSNSLDDLTGIVRDANGEIDVLKSTAAALQGKTEYVRSYTDENGQPCLELGEGDSTFKVRITNTEIQFVEGTAIPARVNRQMLIIEKAMVRSELQIGDDNDSTVNGVWIWKRRANGNLGLMWKGG